MSDLENTTTIEVDGLPVVVTTEDYTLDPTAVIEQVRHARASLQLSEEVPEALDYDQQIEEWEENSDG